jgi:2-dehydro-3-deoxygalactonokinase
VAQSVEAGHGELVSELFRCRGRYILGALDPACAASWLSGLLIGHEILRGHPGNTRVCFIGSRALLPLYQQACEQIGLPCSTLEAETALIAGLNEVFRHDS